ASGPRRMAGGRPPEWRVQRAGTLPVQRQLPRPNACAPGGAGPRCWGSFHLITSNAMRSAVPELRIRFQHTPNPNAGKFILDREVVAGGESRSFFTPEEAQGDPLAE